MNRYDWLLWAFRLFMDGRVIETAKTMIKEMDALDGSGASKREFVVEMLKAQLKRGSVYILRALIEVLLAQYREENDGHRSA